MMKLNLHVGFDDGSGVEVVASMPDFIAFERKYDKPVQAFADEARIEYMCYLAWHSLQRKGVTDKEFDPWLEAVAELTVGSEEDVVPLENSQPTGQ